MSPPTTPSEAPATAGPLTPGAHRRPRAVALLLCALALPCAGLAVSPPDPCWRPATAVPLTDPGCAPLTPPQLSCWQPADVQGVLAQRDLNTRQRATDLYAWQQLIAVNWPADPARPGQPDPAKGLDAPGPRVWQTWRDVDSVFLPNGADPGPWDRPPAPPAACAAAGASRVMHRTAKVDDLLDAMVQPTGADATLPPILTDQAGRAVRFDIRMNQAAYDYVRAQRLYDGSRQMQSGAASFPPGAILAKGAWREVTAAEQGRFLTELACVCDQAPDGALAACAPRRMGLVGLHLMAKTPSAPQWIWATYEQADNVAPTQGPPASFNDPACPPERCPPDRVRPLGVPTQVTRVIPIPDRRPDCARPGQSVDDVRTLNADLARALGKAGSVLAHYELVGAQWPLTDAPAGAAATPVTLFSVRPELLGNTTLETFIQGSSSCMGCHAMARTNRPDGFYSADFTFTLNGATPQAPVPTVGPPDAAALAGLDPATQAQVQRGYQLATQTHELRPDVAPARLHCTSCHLDAGRNPSAAWWVAMDVYWPVDPAASGPDAPTTLQQRINQCFTHSLNGSPLCVPGVGDGSCATDADMKALIAYMRWVGDRYRAPGQPARGFPALAQAQGDPARGRATFTQKCAFCHGMEGEGRYQGGVYYRPALWGPHSFNAQAGMAQVGMLAQFVHANMPLGSGGELTVQEAWDLAAFIDGQCRPGKAGCAPPAGQ